MPNFTVETIETQQGYDFVRSDRLRLSLVNHENGQAPLCAGRQGVPPKVSIVGFDRNIADKIEAADDHIRAYCPKSE